MTHKHNVSGQKHSKIILTLDQNINRIWFPQKTGQKTEVENQEDPKTGPSKHILVDNLQNSFNWLPLSISPKTPD